MKYLDEEREYMLEQIFINEKEYEEFQKLRKKKPAIIKLKIEKNESNILPPRTII